MIFQLINEDQANWDDNSLIEAVENILKAFSERKHIVLASSALFDKVTENSAFSSKVRNAASVTKLYRRELQSLIKQKNVNSYIRVDLTQKDSFRVLEENEQTVFESGFGFYTDSLATQNTILIGEDLSDSQFYIHIGNFYIRNHFNLRQCALSASPSHGGGNQTANIYRNFLNEKKLCYCIVDSDKKHPAVNSPRGDTCKAFFENANDFKEIISDQLGQVRILDVHEVESIIPINILSKIFENRQQNEAQIKTIQCLNKMIEKNSDIRKYLDHKKGLTKKQAVELDQRYGAYYTIELNKLIAQNNKCFIHNDEEHFKCDDNCFCLAPMTGRLLLESLNILKEDIIDKKDIDPITLHYWEIIGKDVFSWCCCCNILLRAS